jgi:hypothetical protein
MVTNNANISKFNLASVCLAANLSLFDSNNNNSRHFNNISQYMDFKKHFSSTTTLNSTTNSSTTSIPTNNNSSMTSIPTTLNSTTLMNSSMTDSSTFTKVPTHGVLYPYLINKSIKEYKMGRFLLLIVLIYYILE